MTEAQKHKGLVRMALMGVAFLALTVVLIVFQPGSPRHAQNTAAPEASVTRVAPALDDMAGASLATSANRETSTPVAIPEIAETTTSEPGSMRDLTFAAISNLKSATTGEAPAPGEPGSLLHSVVQRSLGTAPPVQTPQSPATETSAKALRTPTTGSYFVRPGDTLVSIAQEIYGDVNMASALFEANTDVIARPDSLRPGLVLEVPSR